jgi:hypothetical protein
VTKLPKARSEDCAKKRTHITAKPLNGQVVFHAQGTREIGCAHKIAKGSHEGRELALTETRARPIDTIGAADAAAFGVPNTSLT